MSTPHADAQLAAADDIASSAAGAYDTPLGITNPPIDELLDRASSKYALVIYAAKRRARSTITTTNSATAFSNTSAPWSSRVCRRSRCPSRCGRSTRTCSSTLRAASSQARAGT